MAFMIYMLASFKGILGFLVIYAPPFECNTSSRSDLSARPPVVLSQECAAPK